MSNFYKDIDLTYPEIGILMEDSIMKFNHDTKQWEKQPAKLLIPILMPDMYSEDAINNTNYDIGKKISSSNYFLIDIPSYLYPAPVFSHMTPVKYEEDTPSSKKTVYTYNDTTVLKKGTKFIVVFIGGSFDIDDIKIIGISEEVK